MIKLKRKYYKVNLENPIKNKKDDIFGYDCEVKRIKNAIKDDANVIGIVSEYGSGKSSLIQLLINKLFFLRYKIIRVNLWDNKLKIIDDKDKSIPSEKSIVRLHKMFLRQVSSQTKKYNSAYINRRINANYGAAKISFPSFISLFKWFLIYILLLVGLLYIICKFGFDISSFNDISAVDKKNFISYIIPKIPTIIIGFAFFYIIFNKEVLFSFWNNSKSREITEEDTIQIYNELFGKKIKFLPRLRRIVIIIEDLDRIEDNDIVEFYLNEFYRLYIEGNEQNRKGITLIFCLKDDKKDSSESKYIKIFDYISYINQINIDDKDEVLRQLINRDDLLYDLSFDKENKVIDISKLSWLIEGQNINIRTIKRRIEHFKNIYLMICSRGKSKNNKNDDLDINIVMCSFVAYLKTEYNDELDYILSHYDSTRANYIDIYVNKKVIGESINSDNITFEGSDSDKIKEVKKLIINMINSGYIDSQYKKYFYNFPKGTKIYTTTEKYVSDTITTNTIIDKDNLSNIIMTFNKIDSSFITDRIKNVITLGKDVPNVALFESKAFQSAKLINKNKLNDKFKNILSLKDINIESICRTIDLLKESNIDKNELAGFISNIVSENINNDELELDTISRFRDSLINCFNSSILNFEDLYNKHQITENEIKKISNLDVLIAVSKIINHDDNVDTLICNQFNLIDCKNKSNYLFQLFDIIHNYKLIYDINIDYLSLADKQKIYQMAVNKNISCDEKLELLLYLDYIDIAIVDELLSQNVTNEDRLIDYLNKQTTCTSKCINYINKSKKLYNISDIIFDALDKNSEKYHAYYLYRNHKIDDYCDNNMILNIFLNYSEVTSFFKNSDLINILKQQKVYKKLNINNVTKEKIIVLTGIRQTKDIAKSIMQNNEISGDIKCVYLENISDINSDAAKYIMSLINQSTPVEILKSINKNKNRIYSSLNLFNKIKFSKELNKLI